MKIFAKLVKSARIRAYVSIDPILVLDGVADALKHKPVVAVSPIVGGQAVKGPLASMIRELTGAEPAAVAVARHYRERYGALVGGWIVERGDEGALAAAGFRVRPAATVMRTRDDRVALARAALHILDELRR